MTYNVRYAERRPALLAQAPKIVARVADQYAVRACDVIGPSKGSALVPARFTAIYALSLTGLIPADIARYMHRNHSTVVHALKSAEQSRSMRAVAREVVLPPRKRLVRTACGAVNPALVSAVVSYIEALVHSRPVGQLAYSGLVALSRDRGLRDRVGGALGRSGKGSHIWRIREQARQAGLPWIE